MPRASAARPMSLASAVSLGVGAMVGAGIIALVGESGALAGRLTRYACAAAAFLVASFATEWVLQRTRHRLIRPRIVGDPYRHSRR